MGIIISASNFSQGSFQEVAVSNLLTNRLNAAIARWEKFYINYLLSLSTTTSNPTSIAAGFIADALANNNVPVIPINVNLYDPLQFQVGRKVYQSKGMVDIISSLVFYHYVTDKVAYDSQAGIAAGEVDAAKRINLRGAYRFAEQRWNDALESIECLTRYLKVGNGGLQVAGNGGSIDYPQYIEPIKLKAAYSSIIG